MKALMLCVGVSVVHLGCAGASVSSRYESLTQPISARSEEGRRAVARAVWYAESRGIEKVLTFYGVAWVKYYPDEVEWSVGFIRKPDATNDAEYGVGSGFGVMLDAEMKPYYLTH